MRLVCGLFHLDGSAAAVATLDRMAAAMIAPGLRPSVGRWTDGPVGLAVVDFTGSGAAPVAVDGWVVAADVRLDRPDGAPETVLTAALRDHGPDFPDRVDGDFAVAAWRRDRGELWLGRDYIGARPLAFTVRPGRWVAFASLPKGLHGAGLAAATPDPVAVGLRLTQGYFPRGDSGFSEIAMLEAGHSLRVTAAAPRPHRAYRPDPAAVGRWRGTPEQAAAELRRLVEAAVAARLPAAGPVACHLTGGLDSSAITVIAARALRRRGDRVIALGIRTASAIGPADLDERPLVDAVLAAEPDVVSQPVDDVLPMPGMAGDPDWPGSLLDGADARAMAAAAAFGADRLLSGVGGDEAASYNGAGLYAALLQAGHLATLARELPARARADGVSLARTLLNRVVRPLLSSRPARPGVRRPWRRSERPASPFEGGGHLRADVAARMAARRLPWVLRTNRPAERVAAIADHHIPSRCTYYSILAARHGLSVSFPLLDRRVVDFVLSLPLSHLLADGQARQPFRRAMRGILPEPVRTAPNKVGLFDQRLVRYAERRDEILAALAALRANPGAAAAILDLDGLAARLADLPDPGEGGGLVRARAGGLSGGRPPWVVPMAVEHLIAGLQLAGLAPTAGDAPDQAASSSPAQRR